MSAEAGENARRSEEDEILQRLKQVEDELERERKKAEENHELFLRARADLENFRKRVDREVSHRIRVEKSSLVMGILEVIDNLDRALDQVGAEGGAVVEGLKVIRRQIDMVLAAEGITPIQAEGLPFDPAFHEAAEVVESDEVQVETVATELRKGYMYGDEVFRPTRARVKRPPAPGDRSGV